MDAGIDFLIAGSVLNLSTLYVDNIQSVDSHLSELRPVPGDLVAERKVIAYIDQPQQSHDDQARPTNRSYHGFSNVIYQCPALAPCTSARHLLYVREIDTSRQVLLHCLPRSGLRRVKTGPDNHIMPSRTAKQNSWEKRIARANELASQYLFAAEILRFYMAIARFQEVVSGKIARSGVQVAGPRRSDLGGPGSGGPGSGDLAQL